MNKERDYILLNLSGGATKIGGIFGAVDYLYNVYGYRPTDISGISSGALLMVPIALRKWDVLRELVQTFTLDDIFDKRPVNKNNELTWNAKLRAIFGKSSFGTQNNLYKTISKTISEKEFERYQSNDLYPNCWVGSVDFITGKRFIVNLKDKMYKYCDYKALLNASASIPLAVEPVRYMDMLLYDGGVRNHILSTWFLRSLSNVKEVISIYSRPQDYVNVLDQDWKDRNIIDVFERLEDIQTIEISKKDEIYENLLIKNYKKKIKSTQIFIPSIIKELYDTDPIKLRKLYSVGFKTAANKFTV